MLKKKLDIKNTQAFYVNPLIDIQDQYMNNQIDQIQFLQRVKNKYDHEKDKTKKIVILSKMIEFASDGFRVFQMNQIQICLNKIKMKEKVTLGSDEEYQLIMVKLSHLLEKHGSMHSHLHDLYNILKCFHFKAENAFQGEQLNHLGQTVILKLNQIQFMEQATDINLIRLAIQFIHFLVNKTHSRSFLQKLDQDFKRILLKLMLDIQKNPQIHQEIQMNKLAIQILKSLQLCLQSWEDIEKVINDKILIVLLQFIFQDTKHKFFKFNNFLNRNQSYDDDYVDDIHYYLNRFNDNSNKDIQIDFFINSSDISDIEHAQNGQIDQSQKIKLKVQCLITLNQLVINNQNLSYQQYLLKLLKPRLFSKDLNKFIDDEQNKPIILLMDKLQNQDQSAKNQIVKDLFQYLQMDFKEPNLLYFILFEKNIAIKQFIFKNITSLLQSIPQKLFLTDINYQSKLQKKKSQQSSSFVSFSQQIFNTVQNLIKTLLLSLYLEDQEDVYMCLLEALQQIIDCSLFDNVQILNIRQIFLNVLIKILQESLSYKLKVQALKTISKIYQKQQFKELIQTEFQFNFIEYITLQLQNELNIEKLAILNNVKIKDNNYVIEIFRFLNDIQKLYFKEFFENIELFHKVFDQIFECSRKESINQQIYLERLFIMIKIFEQIITNTFCQLHNESLVESGKDKEKQKIQDEKCDQYLKDSKIGELIEMLYVILQFQGEQMEQRGLNLDIMQMIQNMSEKLMIIQDNRLMKEIMTILKQEEKYTKSKSWHFMRTIGCMFYQPMIIKNHLTIMFKMVLSLESLENQENMLQIQSSWAIANLLQCIGNEEIKEINWIKKQLLTMSGSQKEKVQSNALRAISHLIQSQANGNSILFTFEQLHALFVQFFSSKYNKIHQMLNECYYQLLKKEGEKKYQMNMLKHNNNELLMIFMQRSMLKSNNRLTLLSKQMNVEGLLRVDININDDMMMCMLVKGIDDMNEEILNVYYQIGEGNNRTHIYTQISILIRLLNRLQLTSSAQSLISLLVQDKFPLLVGYLTLFIYHNMIHHLVEMQRFEQIVLDDEQLIFNTKSIKEEQIIFVNNQQYRQFKVQGQLEEEKRKNMTILKQTCIGLEQVIEKNDDINLSMLLHEALMEYSQMSWEEETHLKLFIK